MWEGAEGGRTVGRLVEVFARTSSINGVEAYQRWCRNGYQFGVLRSTLDAALDAAPDRLTSEQVSTFAHSFGISLPSTTPAKVGE